MTKRYCIICKKRIHYPQIKYCRKCAYEVWMQKGNAKANKKYWNKQKAYISLSKDEQVNELQRFAKDYLDKINNERQVLKSIKEINDRLQSRIVKMNQRTRVLYGLPKNKRIENRK